jgi:hypothetical protein
MEIITMSVRQRFVRPPICPSRGWKLTPPKHGNSLLLGFHFNRPVSQTASTAVENQDILDKGQIHKFESVFTRVYINPPESAITTPNNEFAETSEPSNTLINKVAYFVEFPRTSKAVADKFDRQTVPAWLMPAASNDTKNQRKLHSRKHTDRICIWELY